MKLRHVLMAGTAVLAFSGQAYADGHAKVVSNPSKAAVTITGQIQRQVSYIDDGSSQRFRHSEQSQSESGIDIKGKSSINKDSSAFFHIDLDVDTQKQSPAGDVSGGFAGEASGDLNTPQVYVGIKSNSLGTVKIGNTSAAADGIMHTSLHGAAGFSAGLGASFLGNITLRDEDGTDSGNNVGDRITAGDPGGRSPMVRYETPNLAGFSARVSHEDAGHVSVGAMYGGSLAGLKVKAQAGYHDGDGDANDAMTGAIAVKHSSGLGGGFNYSFFMDGVENTAVNQTTANSDLDNHNFNTHLFYQAKFSDMGATTTHVEWMQSRDDGASGAEANYFAVGIGQKIDAAAIDLYAKFINVKVTEPGEDYETVQAVDTGIRMKF